MEPKKIEELELRITKLESQLNDLAGSYYKNNFTSSQVFNKASVFTTRLRPPVFSTAPSVCEVGDLIVISGVLYICTVANTTFTVVGTQT